MPRKKEPEVPTGWRLRHTLRGHKVKINNIAWAPDGSWLASAADDGTVRVWNPETGKQLHLLEHAKGKHEKFVFHIGAMSDGHTLVSGTRDCLKVWDAIEGKLIHTLTQYGPLVVPIPGGEYLLTTSGKDEKVVCLVSLAGGEEWRSAKTDFVYGPFAAATPDGRYVIVSFGVSLAVFEVSSGKVVDNLLEHQPQSHDTFGNDIHALAVSPQGTHLAAGSEDKRIYIYNLESRRLERTLEGHTEMVTGMSFSPDGRLLVSKGWQENIRLWDTETWQELSVVRENQGSTYVGVTPRFHPKQNDVLATFGGNQLAVRVWDLDLDEIVRKDGLQTSVSYVTAKIALTGDSGVGKSGLGLRLAKHEFIRTESTHGQQFWVVDQLGTTRADGTLCEVVLWDFAGQADYRIVHALFLDDIDLGLLLFDASNPQEPFGGVLYWLKHLQNSGKATRQILVAARVDRSQPVVTTNEIDEFCRENGIAGGYVATSALEGTGISELMERIRTQIGWDEMSTTVTTQTFRQIKQFVLGLKEQTSQRRIVTWPELRQMLEATDPNWAFTDVEMQTAVGHLQKHGYVTLLRTSIEGGVVLLQPELLINLASSIVLTARGTKEGLGSLDEDRLRRGEYSLPEVKVLAEEERASLLDGAISLFLGRAICFREQLGSQTLLVFPELINVRPPAKSAQHFEDGPTYRLTGSVEHIYASVVVLLGYTNTFTRSERWTHRAQFEADGYICGFQQTEHREGEIELVLYYGPGVPASIKMLFEGLFETYLKRAKAVIRKYVPVICPRCGTRQQRNAVIDRLENNKDFIGCSECLQRISLSAPDELTKLPPREAEIVTSEQVRSSRQAKYEEALVYVKREVQSKNLEAPTCFISYAWGDSELETWVAGLATDLAKAGVDVILDQWDNMELGASVSRFVSRLSTAKYVLVIGTPQYVTKRDNVRTDHPTQGYVLSAEADLIEHRLTQGSEDVKKTVVPLLVAGTPETAFPALLQGRVYASFQDESQYFLSLFDLLLTIFGLMRDPAMRELRATIRPPNGGSPRTPGSATNSPSL